VRRLTILLLPFLILTIVVGLLHARSLDADRIYTVRSGDTLWDLAEDFLGSPWLWPLIWKANPSLVEHPHWIYPGESLYIPPNVPPELPKQIRVRIRDEEPIFTLSREQLLTLWRRLLEHGGFVSPDYYLELAHIIRAVDEDRQLIALYDDVYVSGGDDKGLYPGAQFLVFRDMGKLYQPESRVEIGRLITNVGVVEVTEVFDEVSRATVISSFEAINPGDGLRFREEIDEEFLRFRTDVPPPEWESEAEALAERGYICRERDGRSYSAEGDVVYVNWGAEQRLQPGARLLVYRQGELVEDPGDLGMLQLPDEKIGTLGVLKVTETTATCLVLGSTRRLLVGDYVDYVRE